MAQATNNSNKRSTAGWLTVSLLLTLALCSQAFATPASYTYDKLNRLTEVNYNNGQQVITYTYDAAGNLLSRTIVVDTDGDGIPDNLDNCIDVANADQRDTDGDGYGNMCDGDLNNDGVVDSVDLGLLKQVFMTNNANADFNGDGIVNSLDLGLFKKMYNKPPGPSGTVSTTTTTRTTTLAAAAQANQRPYQPVILAVSGKVSLQGQRFDVEGFNDPDISLGDYLTASEWQISTASDFSKGKEVFHKVLEKTAAASEVDYRRLTVPVGVLVKATDYWIRTRHRDSHGLWSDWSAPFGFTTVAVNPHDLDADGVDDRYQIAGYVDTNSNGVDDRLEGIRALHDAQTGDLVGIKTGSGTLTELTSTPKSDIPANLLPADALPYGLFNFRIEGLPVDAANPATVNLTFYFPDTLPADAKWYKYDLAGNTMIDITANVLFNANQAVVTLTDGGITDADGVVNGVIVDPGGPALPVATSTVNEASTGGNTSATSDSGGGGGGCSIRRQDSSIDPVLPLLVIWSLLYLIRRRCGRPCRHKT